MNYESMETKRSFRPAPRLGQRLGGILIIAAGAMLGIWLAGCKSSPSQKANGGFFTSGSREADQRASQRMAQQEQLSGSGSGSGKNDKSEKGVKGEKKESKSGESGGATTNGQPIAPEKETLYLRLGAETGISNLVSDFTQRALDDPRVNWDRKGVTQGGFLSLHAGKSETWNPSPQNVAVLKKHLIEFLALATGGPPQYTGKEIEGAHKHMHISNPEFDAVMGDLKSSLDNLKVPNTEQKELLAIVESTRPEIVTER
jgi:hemoglobin